MWQPQPEFSIVEWFQGDYIDRGKRNYPVTAAGVTLVPLAQVLLHYRQGNGGFSFCLPPGSRQVLEGKS